MMLVIDACTLAPITARIRHQQRIETTMTGGYLDRMPVSASQLAAVLREHLPGAPVAKLHRLLYYIQGHHLALRHRPAFPEQVLARPDGPEIDQLNEDATAGGLPESAANAMLMVITRYGYLTTNDLNRLTRAEPPWRDTRPGQEIDHDLMTAFFAGDGAQEGIEQFTPEYLAYLRREVTEARSRPASQALGIEELLARVAGRGRR